MQHIHNVAPALLFSGENFRTKKKERNAGCHVNEAYSLQTLCSPIPEFSSRVKCSYGNNMNNGWESGKRSWRVKWGRDELGQWRFMSGAKIHGKLRNFKKNTFTFIHNKFYPLVWLSFIRFIKVIHLFSNDYRGIFPMQWSIFSIFLFNLKYFSCTKVKILQF